MPVRIFFLACALQAGSQRGLGRRIRAGAAIVHRPPQILTACSCRKRLNFSTLLASETPPREPSESWGQLKFLIYSQELVIRHLSITCIGCMSRDSEAHAEFV